MSLFFSSFFSFFVFPLFSSLSSGTLGFNAKKGKGVKGYVMVKTIRMGGIAMV